MTVSELLNVPSIKGLKLTAGEFGIHKNISTVTVVDTPDGAAWLRGNEVVITTAYALKDVENGLCEFVEELAGKNVAALAVKVNRYIKKIPQSAIDTANRLNFPLITCPDEYAFADIINPVLSNIVDRQSQMLKQSDQIHEKFLELAVNNNSVPEILQALSVLIKKPVAFIDTHFKQCYYSDYNSKIAKILQNLSFDAIYPATLSNYDCYTVANKNEEFGHIVSLPVETGSFLDSELESNIYQTAMEYASVVLILRMQMRISNYLIEEKYHASFIEDLLLNNVKTEMEIYTRAQLYGWEFSNGGVVVIVDINNIKKYYLKKLDANTNAKLEIYIKAIFDAAIKNMVASFPTCKHYKQSDFIAFIIPEAVTDQGTFEMELELVFNRIRKEITRGIPFTVTIGVGDYCRNIRDISKSYTQAKSAIAIGYQLERFDCILNYSRLGLYRLLTTVSDSREARELYEKYIKPLVIYDAKHHTEFVSTLQVIIACGWNLKMAAEKLFVHYNSAKYRFQKIGEILGVDLREHDHRVAIEIALKIYLMGNDKRVVFD